jgi:hypothetical protein
VRITARVAGPEGLRDEVLALEEQLAPGLARLGANWSSSHGPRSSWLLSCRSSTSVVELAQLLVSLEEHIHELQGVAEVYERKPWRTDGHSYIGMKARRFFVGHGASDGRITGWLPPEHDDPALWHMVHGDDDDEEDLDEAEARFAIDNFVDNRQAMTEEEAAYLAQFDAAAKGAGGDDEAAEDEDVEEDVVLEAEDVDDGDIYLPPGGDWRLRGGRGRDSGRDNLVGGGGKGSVARRLWITAESRDRWLEALKGTPSVAVVGLAVAGLREHCRAFGVLVEPKGALRLSREDAEVQLHSWCHAKAFGSISKAKAGKKPKKKRGGR